MGRGVILTFSTGESYSTPPPSYYQYPMVRTFQLYIKATAKVKSKASLVSIFKLLDFKTGLGNPLSAISCLKNLADFLGTRGRLGLFSKSTKCIPYGVE